MVAVPNPAFCLSTDRDVVREKVREKGSGSTQSSAEIANWYLAHFHLRSTIAHAHVYGMLVS